MRAQQPDPRTPTLPSGVEVASYPTYLEAQQAVDHLSDEAFDVRQVTIVGSDLRLVERVTGRLTYARVAGAGAMSGAWFGLMISLLFWVFAPDGQFPLLAGILIGAAFGILFAVVSYALTGGKRDFTSTSQVVASRYSVLCSPELAGQARQLLTAGGHGGRGPAAAVPTGAGARGPLTATGPGPAGTGPAGPGPQPPSSDNPYAPPTSWSAPGGSRPAGSQPTGTQPGGTQPGGTQPGTGQPAQQPDGGREPAPGTAERPTGDEPPQRRERPRYGVRLEDLEEPGEGRG
ncbi:hypothetical protein MF406_14685 [Georgenia sp. TF02-10]|uniref:general stress protein n=1 Tax=Georgenia sp. TF02-10 TaxID=2917725 RepID=UPI001FA734AA|nr:general stress protein [Georgenia sp. TF02-10]UNX54169.1 hypothetical protein MF406_14685 [Georgenia sp. TF02-10]